MGKKGQFHFVFSSRTLVFIFGCAILGFLITDKMLGAIIGGLIGLIISFLR